MSATCWAEGLDRPYFSGRPGGARTGSRQDKFIDECKKRFTSVWNSVTWDGETVALCASATSLVLAFSMTNDLVVCKNQNVSFAQVHCDNGKLNVLVGESTGQSRQYTLTENRTLNASPVFQSTSASAVQSVIACGQDIWLVQDRAVSLWRAGACKLQLTLGGPVNTKYLSAQLLSTVDGGPASLLSVLCASASPHTPSSSTGKAASYAQVYLIDTRAAREIAAKSAAGSSRTVSISPLCEVPFNATGEASTPGLSPASLFSFGRTAIQAGGDSIVRGEIDPASVRTFARRQRDRDTAVLADAAAEAVLAGAVRNVSFVVRLQSLQGTEVAGACRCTAQKVIDRFSQVGCEVFSRPCSTLLPSGLHTEIAVQTFRADGTALSAEPSLTPLFSAVADADPLPLWKAALSLDLLSPSRKAHFEGLLQDAETCQDDSSRYFVPARMVLLETALSAGLGHLVASYVLCRSEDAAAQPSGFLLADVRRFYDWAFATPTTDSLGSAASVQGLQSALERATQALCRDYLAQALLTADASCSHRAGWMDQILQLRTVAAGLGQVTEALLERKLAALEDSASAEDAVLQSVIEEGQMALRVHMHELKCLVRVLSLLYEIGNAPDLTFRALLTGELHQRHSSGRVHSSSSSAAATAAMLSQYQVARQARNDLASTGQQTDYLPEYLRAAADGSTLFDSLCRLLGPGLLAATEFLRVSGESALGVNLSALCKEIAAFLLLPLTAVKEAAAAHIGAGQRGVGITGTSSTATPEELDTGLNNASNVAFSVVLFFLAEMRHLNSSPASDSESAHVSATQGLVRSVGTAADVPLTVRNGVLALWQVEADVGVSQAVRVICSADATVQHDQDILVAVIKRLLSSQRLAECQSLLQHLQRSGNALTGTKFFVMATAAAIARSDTWKFSWHAAKELAAGLHPQPGSAEAVLLRRELMQLCVRWALCHDEMAGLLTSALDKEEGEELEVVLRSLAGRDVDHAVFPSAAVDTCVAFLLREAKFEDAITVHEQHAFAVSAHAGPASAEWPTIQFQLASRRELIVAHASIPTIPVDCFRG